MLQIRNLRNALQKRLIRPLYAHTQATAWAGVIDAELRDPEHGGIVTPEDAFTLQNGLVPGTVMVRTEGEAFTVADPDTEVPAGLLANFVGGTLDDLQDENMIGVWYGVGSQWELLAPAFNDDGLLSAHAGAQPGSPVLLYTQEDGRLGVASGDGPAVAELIQADKAKIQIKLLV